MNNYPAFICHGGLGDLYVELLQIKARQLTECDVYYRDELCVHSSDIETLYKSQKEIKLFDSLRIKQTDEYLSSFKTELLQRYSEVYVLTSTLSNISTIKNIELAEWKNTYGKDYITINTGAGNFQLPSQTQHNVNRRWSFNAFQNIVNFLTIQCHRPVVLLGTKNDQTKELYNLNNPYVKDASDKKIIEQLQIIQNANLNVTFEGFSLIASVSFNKPTVVKNNPPFHDFHKRDIRYLDSEAYKNITVLEDYSAREFLPILRSMRNKKI